MLKAIMYLVILSKDAPYYSLIPPLLQMFMKRYIGKNKSKAGLEKKEVLISREYERLKGLSECQNGTHARNLLLDRLLRQTQKKLTALLLHI